VSVRDGRPLAECELSADVVAGLAILAVVLVAVVLGGAAIALR